MDEAVTGMLPQHLMNHDGKFSGTYVDCTFGRGGHTREILSRLSPDAKLFAFDVDPTAISVARELEAEDSRFKIIHRPFGDLAEEFGPGELDGVLADIGVSSPQLDETHRGFNSKRSGPLDMRMNQENGVSASQWLQGVSQEELAWVIHNYGEDDDIIVAQRIAATIIKKQQLLGGAIRQTGQLSDIIRKAKGDIDGFDPCKLTFQAIRVFLNQEMQQLDLVLEGAMTTLKPDGKLSVIAFKKKEANAIRRFVRENEEPDYWARELFKFDEAALCELYPLLTTDKDSCIVQHGPPKRPTQSEIEENSRSRSSQTFFLEKKHRQYRVREELKSAPLRPIDERFKKPEPPKFAGGSRGHGFGRQPCAARNFAEADEVDQRIAAASNRADTATEPSCATAASSAQRREVSPAPSHSSDRTDPGDLVPPQPQPFLTNTAPEHDAQPASGLNAALGSAFTTHGIPNYQSGDYKCLRVVLDYQGSPGYLTLQKGQIVVLEYEGRDAAELGWCYGQLRDDLNPGQASRGWYHRSHVKEMEEDDTLEV